MIVVRQNRGLLCDKIGMTLVVEINIQDLRSKGESLIVL